MSTGKRPEQTFWKVLAADIVAFDQHKKTMLDDLAPKNPKAAAADPKTYVDMSLIAELDKSGFIKQLYRK